MAGYKEILGEEAAAALERAGTRLLEAKQEFKAIIPTRKDVLTHGSVITAGSLAVGGVVTHVTHGSHHMIPAIASALSTATALVTGEAVRLFYKMSETSFGRLVKSTVAAAVHEMPLSQDLLASDSRMDRWAGRRVKSLQERAGRVHGAEDAAGLAKSIIAIPERIMHPVVGDAPATGLKRTIDEGTKVFERRMDEMGEAMAPIFEAAHSSPHDEERIEALRKEAADRMVPITAHINDQLETAKRYVLDPHISVTERPQTSIADALVYQQGISNDLKRDIQEVAENTAKRQFEAGLEAAQKAAPIMGAAADELLPIAAQAAKRVKQDFVEPAIVESTDVLKKLLDGPAKSKGK